MFLKKCFLVCPRWETWQNIDREQCFRNIVSHFAQGFSIFVVRGGGGDGCVGDADADNAVVRDVCYAGSIEI